MPNERLRLLGCGSGEFCFPLGCKFLLLLVFADGYLAQLHGSPCFLWVLLKTPANPLFAGVMSMRPCCLIYWWRYRLRGAIKGIESESGVNLG